MSRIVLGFVLGFLIPFIARRLGKILPATTGIILYRLLHVPHFAHANDPLRYKLLQQKWKCLFLNAFIFAVLNASLFFLAHLYLPAQIRLYADIFIWIILLAANVDMRFYLLPDCLTIPLLLSGFLFSTQTSVISTEYSIYGALFGYVIVTISVFLTCTRHTHIFGAGDSKMIIAIGAWLGVQGLNYTFLASFLLFVIYSFLLKSRSGAYGPALGLASLLSFFILYAK